MVQQSTPLHYPETITVLGAGYVGLTTATVLAHAGYKVYIVEPNKERLAAIKRGKSFFFEHGLNSILGEAIKKKTLIPTDSYKESVPRSQVVFSCVGTPDNPDGSSNLSYVFSAAESAAELMQPRTIFVQKSTVPVGTGKRIIERFKAKDADIAYVSNPEFLREGTALFDTLFFDRVVAGGDDQKAVNQILDIYMTLEQFREHIAHIARVDIQPRGDQYIATSLNSAELIKVTSNAFLALKISFANSIALLADKADADVVEVMDAVGADNRIGRAFLNAGRGYGGGCFPKDVSGLISSGLDYGVDLDIMNAAQLINESMPGYIVDKLQDVLGGSLENKKIAVLGLAFKAGTSDTRKSPGVAIANKLRKAGAEVATYDPEAKYEAVNDLYDTITIVDSIDNAIQGTEATLITTEWNELIEYPASRLADKMTGTILFDTINQYDALAAKNAGLTYIGVGHNI